MDRTPPIYNIHASDSRFILSSDSFSKIENQDFEKLILEIMKVNLYKNPQKKAFKIIDVFGVSYFWLFSTFHTAT